MNPQRKYRPQDDVEPATRPNLRLVQGGGQTSPPQNDYVHEVPGIEDDEEESDIGSGLRSLEGGGESTPRERGHLSAVGNDDLNTQEDEAANDIGGSGDQVGLGFTGGPGPKQGIMARLQGNSKLKKQLMVGGAVAGGFGTVALLIFLLFLLLSFLKIPGLAQNITNYQFARVERQAAKSADRVTEEDLAVKAAGDGGIVAKTKKKFADVYNPLKEKYQNIKDGAWDKLDNVLPGSLSSKTIFPSKVIQTLKTTNGFSFGTTLSSTGRPILTSITVNGQTYPIEQVTGIAKWTPGLNSILEAKNQAVVVPAISKAMQNNNVGLLVRGLTAIKLRAITGITLKAWTLSKFTGKDQQQAKLEAVRETYAKTQAAANAPDNPNTAEIKKADQDVKNAEAGDVASDPKLTAAIASGGTSAGVVAALNASLSDNLTDKAIKLASGPIYAFVQPFCIASDGAVANSGDSINNRTNQAQATFYDVASGGDQQEAGSSDSSLTAAIQASNSVYGDTNKSIAYQRGYNNGYASTASSMSAESGAGGTYSYSLLDALGVQNLGSTTARLINLTVNNLCPALTNTVNAVGIGLISILASDGFTEAAGDAAGQGALKFIQTYTTKIITGAVTKQLGEEEGGKLLANNSLPRVAAYLLRSNAKSYLIKNGTVLGLTVGLTEAAHLLVAQRSGVFFSGLAQGTDAADEADDGGNFTASQLDQTEQFGAPMTKDQVAASAAADNQYLAYQTSQQSAYTRYLSPTYANSLVFHIATDISKYQSSPFVDTTMSLGSIIMQPLRVFGTLFTTLSGKASAAPDYNADTFDYGNVQFGWTEAEEKLIDSNFDSYSMLENQRILDESGQESAIATKYAKCFGYKFVDNGTNDFDPGDPNSEMQLDIQGAGSIGSLKAGDGTHPDIATDDDGNVVNDPNALCSPDNLSYDSTDSLAVDPDATSPERKDMIMRWRLAMRYDLTSDRLASLGNVTN